MKFANLMSFEAVLKELSFDAREQFEEEFKKRTEQIAHDVMSDVSSKLAQNFSAIVRQHESTNAVEIQFTLKTK